MTSEKYDSVIILSNKLIPSEFDLGISLDKQRKLAPESTQRVKEGIDFYKNIPEFSSDLIIMNGGPGQMTNGKFVPRGTHPVQCELMVAYALQQGVPLRDLMYQDYSADTVGEAFFVKPILREKNLKNNLIVTSEYHINRVKEIYKKIFGKDFSFDIYGTYFIFENAKEEKKQLKNEEKSLELFIKQFGDIDDGDDLNIQKRLYEVHNLYNKIPIIDRYMPYN